MGEVRIEIAADGKVTMEVVGVKGKRCLDYGELLKQIVGYEESRRLTDEYYEAQVHVAARQSLRRQHD